MLNTNEGFQRQEIQQYKTGIDDIKSRLKRVHDIVVRHINAVIREINSEEMTNRAVLYLGKEYEGQEYQFLYFIEQINNIIENRNQINQSELDFLKNLLFGIKELEEMPHGTIDDCMVHINKIQKELNQQNLKSSSVTVLRVLRNK